MVVPALQGGGYDCIRTGTDATTSVPVRMSFVRRPFGADATATAALGNVAAVPRVTRESPVTLA